MAFCNKLGNLLRHGAAQSRQESMLNYIRSMSSSKLFVGGIDYCLKHSYGYKLIYVQYFSHCFFLAFAILGLSYGVDDQSLKDAFASFGDVVEGEFSFLYHSYMTQCKSPASFNSVCVLQFPLV